MKTKGINSNMKVVMKNQQKSFSNQQQLSDEKMDNMLLELRQLISHNNAKNVGSLANGDMKKTTNHGQKPPLTPKSALNNSASTIDIQSLISQSNRLIESRKQFTSTKPSTKGKIMAASQLLRQEKDMIKSYVKDKIQSELFTSENFMKGNNQQKLQNQFSIVDDRHLLKLQQQRQLLIAQKRIEHQKQLQKRQQLISQVKQFENDSRINVDVHQINSLIFKQEPQSGYLVNNESTSDNNGIGKQIKSRSNEVKSSSLFISEVYDQHEIETSRLKESKMLLSKKTAQNMSINNRQFYSNNDQDEEEDLQFIQVNDEIETSSQQFDDRFYGGDSQGSKKLKILLMKKPNFVKIFYEFLENQWAIVKLGGKQIKIGSTIENGYQSIKNKQLPKQGQNSNKNTQSIWKTQKFKPITSLKYNQSRKQQSQDSISAISQQFKFKPFVINDESKIEYERNKVSQRRINKMIGESSKFHSKKCILTKNQLIYFEEKQSNADQKCIELCIPQTTKYIQLEIQRILPEVFKKQEGSFFSKKEINTELVTVKGKARTFKFEYDFLDGRQLVEDLRKLMASKVYALSCKVIGNNNLPLLQYIYVQKMNKFSLQNHMIPIQSYLIKEQRQKHVNILIDSLTDHSQTTSIILKNAKLLPNELSGLFKQCKKLQKLEKIDLTNTRLGKQSFMELCQFVNEIKTPTNGMEIILSNCKLDDDCFMSNVGVFTSFCTKVSKFDISRNAITSKTIQIIKNCLQSITSIVKHLNISHCPIKELTKLGALIKQSRNTQTLQAFNCSLDFDEKRFEQLEKFFEFLKSNSSNIKRVNLAKNGSLTKKQYSMIENQWYQQSIKELIVDISLQMLSDKAGEKELLRTDKNAAGKSILNMKLFNQS